MSSPPVRRLTNRFAVVTGASGVIGKAVAARLSAEGAFVFGTSRTEAGCEQLKQQGHVWAAAPCDFASEASIEACVKSAVALSKARNDGVGSSANSRIAGDAQHAGIDILVHCAGYTVSKLCVRTTEQDFRDLFAANALAPLLLAKHVVRHGGMLGRKGGCCIALGSVVGEHGNAGQVAYAASKGALTAGWKSLAREYGAKGIRFNVVAPGLVDSDMSKAMHPEHVERWIKHSALGRLVTADEVAEAVLAACQNTALTGQVIRVDGGAA